jgi:hypothetical protein
MRQRRTARGIGVIAAAALIAGLVPATALADDVRDTTTVCEERDGNPGNDIAGHTHEAAIRCVASYEIALGYRDGRFGPNDTITRGQMASFIGRSLAVAGAIPSDIELEGGSFTDTAGNTHEVMIELVSTLGIAQGRRDGSYGPGEDVNRGQMAAFLTRLIDHAHNHALDGSHPPEPERTAFPDTQGNTFATQIEQLREAGIFLGDRDGNANPNAAVTRGQMASFIARTAAYLDDIRRWLPTYELLELEIPMSWHNVTDGEGNYRLGEEDAVGILVMAIHEIARIGAYAMAVDGVSTPYPADALTFRQGDIDENGPVLFSLDVDGEHGNLSFDDTADGEFDLMEVAEGDSVADVVEWFDELMEDPDVFYVQLVNSTHTQGAIRGQLPDGGQDRLPAGAGFPGTGIFDDLLGLLPGLGGSDLLPGLGDLIGQLPGLGDLGGLLPGLPGLPGGGGGLIPPPGGVLDPITDPISPITGPILGLL